MNDSTDQTNNPTNKTKTSAMTTIHYLKCVPPLFDDARTGRKPFDVRLDDRDYQVGDILVQREYLPDPVASFTSNFFACQVTYKLTGTQWGLKEGYCVLGIKLLDLDSRNSLEGLAVVELAELASRLKSAGWDRRDDVREDVRSISINNENVKESIIPSATITKTSATATRNNSFVADVVFCDEIEMF